MRIDTEEELAEGDGEMCTYARTGPHGVAREESDLARCQDLALRRQTAVNRITNMYDWEPLNLLRFLSHTHRNKSSAIST